MIEISQNLKEFLFYGFLPLLILFFIERFIFSYYMLKNETRKSMIRNTFFFHPNFITRVRYPIGIISIVIFHFFSHKFAFYLWAVAMISDLTDGTIARFYGLDSKKGADIDPLSDKLLQIPPLFYLSYLGVISFWLVLAYTSIEFVGQFIRRFSTETKANLFGKMKTFLVVILIALAFIQYTYWNGIVFHLEFSLMIGATILSFLSVFFRTIPNHWYGNLLTLTNFLCGIFGMVLIILGFPLEYAFLLIFLGQIVDLYDGRAVRKWGGTPRGELYDDLADGTNFGGTVSFIIIASVENLFLAIPLSLIYFSFTVYRLYRFILNKREQSVDKYQGVTVFQGLPTPASASFVASGLIILNYDSIISISSEWKIICQSAIIILSSFFMISKIPYSHFANTTLPKINILLKVFITSFLLFLLAWSFDTSNFFWFILIIFIVTCSYLIFGIESKKMYNKI